MSRGKRFDVDSEPKLNIKKVIAVILVTFTITSFVFPSKSTKCTVSLVLV